MSIKSFLLTNTGERMPDTVCIAADLIRPAYSIIKRIVWKRAGFVPTMAREMRQVGGSRLI